MTNAYRIPCFLYLSVFVMVSGCQQLNHQDSHDKKAKISRKHNLKVTHTQVSSKKTSLISANAALSFERAAEHVLTNSNTLIAEQASLRSKRLQAAALDDLNQPAIFINGSMGRYNAETDISTDALRNRLRGYGDGLSSQQGTLNGQLPAGIAGVLNRLPSLGGLADKIPSSVHLERQSNYHRLHIGALMPLYTGGRISAIQQLADGRADAQASKVAETKEELLSLLVKRYFLVPLAQKAVNVRKQALHAVKGHDRAAQRMLDIGLIAKSERLQGAAALADAKYQLEKAQDDLRLAHRALDSLLQADNIIPKTPLFINHQVLKDTINSKKKAKKHHPAFAKIKAKDKQAKALKSLSDSAWKPNVSAFGAHELSNDASDWIVGIRAQWTLNSPINRNKMQQAAEATLEQVHAVERQATNDINLLVDKSSLAVSDALVHFDSLNKRKILAKEIVRLKTAGFREGLNTIIELNDAEANLTKTRTERLKAAYEYITALADLLTTTGEFDRFVELSTSADIRLN